MREFNGFLSAILLVFILGVAKFGSLVRSIITGKDESKITEVKTDVAGDDRFFVDAQISGGTLGILPGEISKFVLVFLENGGSSDLRVDGSTTAVIFKAQPQTATEDALISQVRCFGGASQMKWEQFLGLNSPLSVGVEITIISDGNPPLILPLIKTSEDWKNLFISIPFNIIDFQQGADQFIAAFRPGFSFPLRAGSATDGVEVKIQDDLTGVQLSQFQCILIGFLS